MITVLNAIKMFLQRTCHNLLPTKANLLRRGIVKSLTIPSVIWRVKVWYIFSGFVHQHRMYGVQAKKISRRAASKDMIFSRQWRRSSISVTWRSSICLWGQPERFGSVETLWSMVGISFTPIFCYSVLLSLMQNLDGQIVKKRAALQRGGMKIFLGGIPLLKANIR